jgi:hypothetical protein
VATRVRVGDSRSDAIGEMTSVDRGISVKRLPSSTQPACGLVEEECCVARPAAAKSLPVRLWARYGPPHMFRNNPLTSFLVSVLFLAALGTCWFAVRYYFSVKELQGIQFRYQNLMATQSALQSMAAEAVAYSQQNPAINPLLQEFNITNRAVAPTTTPAPPAARPSR